MNALDIDTDRVVTHHTDGRLATVAQIEVDVRMADDGGFTVFTILEDGRLVDAILFAQRLTQQQISGGTGLTPQLMLELQALFPALFRQQGQCRLPVKVLNIVVNINFQLSIVNFQFSTSASAAICDFGQLIRYSCSVARVKAV